MVAKQSLPVLRTNTTRPLTATTSPVSWPGSSAGYAARISASVWVRGTSTGYGGTPAASNAARLSRRTRICSGSASVPSVPSVPSVRSALEPGQETGEVVAVSGRVVFVRNTGKLCFATIQDGIDATSDGTD